MAVNACQVSAPPMLEALAARMPAVRRRGMTEERAPRRRGWLMSTTYSGHAMAKAPPETPEGNQTIDCKTYFAKTR